jgi:hypothetical protein
MAADDATSGDAPESIDPRYDPVFQRGYRGDSTRRFKRGRPLTSAPAVFSPAPRVEPEPASRVYPSAAAAGPAMEPAGETNDQDDGVENAKAPTIPPRTANPYVAALWVIGIVFTVGGAILQLAPQLSPSQGSFSVSEGQGLPVELVLRNLAYAVSTPMITVGMATIVGLIFLLAVAARPGRSDSDAT